MPDTGQIDPSDGAAPDLAPGADGSSSGPDGGQVSDAATGVDTAPPVDAVAGPNAPDHLRVGDRARPLNVEGAPLFSWLPHDSAGNQLQTAYQIQVRLESSGAQVWDSGKVMSGEQDYVAYAGPALMAGESYTWTVRCWNKTDVASGWAAPASFDMGLANTTAGWGASWIRRSASGADANDEYTWARAEKDISAKPVRRARAYVSANHQFELHVNGAIADRGPAFAYPGESFYQASDITALVEAGKPLAVGILYHWYGSGQGRAAGSPGLLARIVVDHDDGTREILVTDGTWKVQRASQWQTGAPKRNSDSGDYVEWIDMRQVPDGWDSRGFAATGWAAAQVIGPHPTSVFTSVRGQEPRVSITVVPPVSVKTFGDGAVVADFGMVMPARPTVRFASGVAGKLLNIQAGYRLTSDGHVSGSKATSQGSDLSFRFTQKAGAQEFRPTTYFGWRYLQVSAPGETLAASAFSALVEHTDAEGPATFESSDATLNAVFALTQRSGIYGVQQNFVDTPTREKGQFLGDAVNMSLATMASWMERDATQKAITDFMASQTRYWPGGQMNAVYPNGDGKRDIPDYTEMFPIWLWNYYMNTGDKTLLGRAYPNMQKICDYVWSARNASTGLVTNLPGGGGDYQYGIIDWPPTERYGYDTRTSARTTVNILAADLLRSTASAATALGRPAAEAMMYTTRADQLVTSINERLRRADGIYIDGSDGGSASTHASQLANSYAVAFQVVPAANRAAVLDYVAGMGMNQGPMTAHWLTKALGDGEKFDALLKVLTDKTQKGWANILSRGGTFTWESWDAATNGDSESHGWGSPAVIDILEAMLGVKVIAPGRPRSGSGRRAPG
ncbi:MAG: family 78 glycoside hydrolase catalytic domain [Myxococcales bacterium]